VTWLVDENSGPKQQDLADHVLARLLPLFIDMLYIFAQDCGGLNGVIEILAAWTIRGSASNLPKAVRPQLLVVASIPSDSFDSEALRFRLRVLSDPKFLELFSSLKVINLLSTGRMPTHQHFSGLL
jgi:hypothetical protein